MLLSFLQTDVFQQERITFNVSEKITVGPLIKVEPQGTIDTSPYVLLFWPAIFFAGGLLLIFEALGLKEAKNLLFGLIFSLAGLMFIFLKAPFPFILIAWTLFIFGILFIVGFIRKLTKR